MDFIRRAWLFTKAKLSRTVLLTVAFTAILVFVLSGLVIHSAANRSINTAKKETGSTVTLAVNMQTLRQKAEAEMNKPDGFKNYKIPAVSKELADKIAKLPGVKTYAYSSQSSANAAADIKAIKSADQQDMEEQSNKGAGSGVSQLKGPMPVADFQILGTNNMPATTEFSSGNNKITAGRAITPEDADTNNVVIEEGLAQSNHMKVGSKFTLKDSHGKTYEMTVVGIYQANAGTNGLAASYSFMNPANQIYTPLHVPNEMQNLTDEVNSAIYTLTDPSKTAEFVKAAGDIAPTSTYQIQSNDEKYQQMLEPLNNVSALARNIVILVAIAGAVILALIVMLMVRERRFEIGVLMSLGESKGRIIAQFFTELFIVMVVSVGLASVTGNIVGNAVGNQLIKQEAQTSMQNNVPKDAFVGTAPQTKLPTPNHPQQNVNLNVQTSPSQIVLLTGIAILITLVSVGLASTGIMRLNPKEILTQ